MTLQTIRTNARQKRWERLLDDLVHIENDNEIEGDAELEQFALIEQSRYDGSCWVTLWSCASDAASYRDASEYPEDRPNFYLLDLDTGQRHEPSTQTAFPTARTASS